MKRNILALVICLVVSLWGQHARASAADIYITPTGSTSGVCTSGVQTPAFFNTSGNWGAGGSQIGPATVVHLCGTFTGSANGTMFTFQGNGSSGNPVTLLFESGTVLTAPYWNFSNGAINMSGRSFVVVSGGTNGIIQNTANGSSLANHQPSAGIVAASCNGCEIKNLAISAIYVSVAPNVIVDQTEVNAIQMSGSNWSVHNNKISDCGWCIRHFYANGDSNNQVFNNELSRFDHAYAYAAGAANAGTGTFFHDNNIHDSANWDCGGGCHHDGVHVFGIAGNTIDNFNVYNNYFWGLWGDSPTGFIFIEGASSVAASHVINSSYYNNVGVVSPGATVNTNGWFGIFSGSGNTQLYNNTIIGGSATDNEACFNVGSVNNLTFKDNVVDRCGDPVNFGSLTNTNGANINNNAYGTSCQNGNNCFVWNGQFKGNFASWKAACACDANAIQNNNLLLGATGLPQTGSPVLGVGANLSSIASGSLAALALDTSLGNTRTPVLRPTISQGPWPAGAYAVGGTVAIRPNPPTGVSAVPH